jgi:phosphoglycolate phosphatase
LLTCCEVLGQGPRGALYVGDSSVDHQTAQNAQLPFRLFSGGYLNTPLPDLPAADRFSDWAAHGIDLS